MSFNEVEIKEELFWSKYNYSLASFCNSINKNEDEFLQSTIDSYVNDPKYEALGLFSFIFMNNDIYKDNKENYSEESLLYKPSEENRCNTKFNFIENNFISENKENIYNSQNCKKFSPYINNLFDEQSLNLLSKYLKE